MLTDREKEECFIEVEAWVYVDTEEKTWAHESLDILKERLTDDGAEPGGRLIRVAIKLPVPCSIDVEATLPAESSVASVSVK